MLGSSTLESSTFGGFYLSNTPLFSPMPIQPLDNTNIQRSVFPTPSSLINWSPSPPLSSCISFLETRPTFYSLKEKNMRGGRGGRSRRSG